MNCMKCQNAMNPQERFCSKCGTDSSVERVETSGPDRSRDWDTHVKIVGSLFIISALFMAIPAVGLLLFPGMIMTGMAQRPFPFAGPFFTSIALAFFCIPVVNVFTGIGLLRYREWARVVAQVLAAFMLIAFPFGTAIGIYTFWVLLSSDGSASYKRGNRSPEGRGWPSREGAPGEG
jgi:hypothetical protein